MKRTISDSKWSTRRASIVILLAILAGIIVWSCPGCTINPSQMNTPPEKVVVIDALPANQTPLIYGGLRMYKVKRFNKGVVTYIVDKRGYDIGDTIFIRILE